MTFRSDRDGFALPMAILVIGFMTAGVVAAFARSTAEVRVVDGQRHQIDSYAAAQAGLERFVASGRINHAVTTPGAVAADTTLTIAGGSARVRAFLIRRGATAMDTSIYLIQADGRVGPANAAQPQGRRMVAQLAYLLSGRMQVLAGWTSLSGVHKNGNAGSISGFDACTSDVLPGIALPDGTFTHKGNNPPVHGSPPVDSMGTQDEMAAEIKIDWDGITNPVSPSITPDVVVCTSGYGYDPLWGPCGTIPSDTDFTLNPNWWPVIIVNGSLHNPPNGRGTLIVTGNLIFGGGDTWDGIILVGGMIDDNGTGAIAGAVVTGLNVLKGDYVPQSSKADGTKDYVYDSCKVAAAASNQAKLIGISNAWVENWTAY